MDAKAFSVWTEWNRTTRFFQSSLIALRRERQLWDAGDIHASSAVTIQDPTGRTKYNVKLADHLKTVADVEMLCMLVLLRSVALMEGHVVDVLARLYQAGHVPNALVPGGLVGADLHDALVGLTLRSGVEAWGTPVLSLVGRSWGSVHEGRKGQVEVAVIRNGLAHGQRVVSQRMENRVLNVGGSLPWPVGDPISLDPETTRRLRDRTRSFIRNVAYGAAQMLP